MSERPTPPVQDDSATSRSAASLHRSRVRVVVMVLAGSVAAVIVGLGASWVYAPAVGWAVAAAVFSGEVGFAVARSDPEQTQREATREDPSTALSDVLILGANIASLAAIAVLMVRASNEHGSARALLAIGSLVSVALSWLLVHTLYTLRYALLYYAEPVGGIDFNQDEPPRYQDFAYLAFTIGMTYQVSDTNLKTSAIRSTALRHSLQSYLFGSVILATTINTVVTLSTSS
jgi:uncharacterized membrane protein